MPTYQYKCKDCEVLFDAFHSVMGSCSECKECNGVNVQKIPSVGNIITKIETVKERKVGDLVEEYIENVKKEISEAKKEARKEFK